ncbi:CoB--CoM heterodisulfide reductase iron-sulfur subunit B family protein [Halodesulfovibrio sp. MK-HDV]|jgi:heterodisulfide reductase subunit B2|uniref:CoB--CoM heterodisulfide reductase iron-sulfur subunit B family protein n=1 Tax=unclassified Halodesulfovibrio TaxID=2644657 RepID=UPI00136AB6FF|nr:CoB--CoM heterodisulfide reductase iron-sulfur subunit B family protein [Halodesulfovibrio sp. MK-HDV]KAF1075120.1 8-methylmenaquinol:fumarate reductase membrane anchor subunit [Halodesulfovibrio sp. MK-HDV]
MSISVGYYPGCSGSGTSVEYDKSTRAVCKKLGIELNEIDDWSCCGSTPAHTVDHTLSAALSARNLVLAAKQGQEEVVTPCPSCLANLRTASRKIEDENYRPKVEALLDEPCDEAASVASTLQLIVERVGMDAIKKAVVKPLKDLNVACYYGCIMNRPPELMQFDDPENPMAMDDIMEACGATVLPFPLKVECCGAAAGMPKKDIVTELSGRLLDVAESLNTEIIVTACPLCQMNLDLRQGQVNRANGTRYDIPVVYFTQLLGLALGLSAEEVGLSKLVVDPTPRLRFAGVL